MSALQAQVSTWTPTERKIQRVLSLRNLYKIALEGAPIYSAAMRPEVDVGEIGVFHSLVVAPAPNPVPSPLFFFYLSL